MSRVRAATVEMHVRMSRGRQAVARYVLFEDEHGAAESVLRIVTEIPQIPPEQGPSDPSP